MIIICCILVVTLLTGLINSISGSLSGLANGAATIVMYGVIIFVAFAFLGSAVSDNPLTTPRRILGRASHNAIVDILTTLAHVLGWIIRMFARGIRGFFLVLLPWFGRFIRRVFNFFNTTVFARVTGWLHRPLATLCTILVVILII